MPRTLFRIVDCKVDWYGYCDLYHTVPYHTIHLMVTGWCMVWNCYGTQTYYGIVENCVHTTSIILRGGGIDNLER